MKRLSAKSLILVVLFLAACEEQYVSIKKEKLNKIEYTSLDRELKLSRAIEQIGLNKNGSSSGRLMSGLTEFKTDSILKVLQLDSSNYSYTIPIVEDASKKSFRNLIFKRVKDGFFAFVLEYVTDEAVINFQSFSGEVKRYDLEGLLLDEAHLSKVKLTNTSGRTMACFADVTVECVKEVFGGWDHSTGKPFNECEEWATVITIDCSGGSGGGGSSGGWSNPGTYVPDPYVGGGGGGGSSSGGTGGSNPPSNGGLTFEGGDPIGVIPPSSWPGSDNGYPYMWWEDDSWLDANFSLAVDQDYNRLTQAEKDLVKLYPAEAYLISKNVNIATSETVTQFGRNGLNDKSDAFRHSYFQSINTRSVGATITKLFSDAHESEVPTELILEKEMDLFNNQVGINYAINNPPRASLSLLIMEALIRGELRYLSPTLPPPFDHLGNPIPGGDPLFNSTHGITSATQLVPTNL
ncbi:MAG: hypothetical protein EWV86_00415 [Microcystis panniformis Mp_MB_F_20051200_S9D]|nr:MAG: hypothetical protein EWV86_00415 [Microcystis panniformis Mp_MB_F_20051200_S9D]